MKRFGGLLLVMAFVAAAIAIWARSPDFTEHAEAVAAPPTGIWPLELHRQIDMKSLPVQETGDLI